MGQKTHPIGFRSGSSAPGARSGSRTQRYRQWLHEDILLRRFLKKELYAASISDITIERAANKLKINIFTARPGIIIGKRGAGVEQLKKESRSLTGSEVFLNIQEVRKAEVNAQLVAENIAQQLERRIAFRRALKKAVQTAMKFGAKGIRVAASGRLGGAEMRRREWYREGRRAAAHPPRRHRLRLLRGPHDLRLHRREVLDLQRRGPDQPPAADPALPAARALATSRHHAQRSQGQVPQGPQGPDAGQAKAGTEVSFGDFGLQASSAGGSPPARSRPPVSPSAATSSAAASSTSGCSPTSRSPRSRPRPAWVRARAPPIFWVAVVKPGRVIYEIEGVDRGPGPRGLPPRAPQAPDQDPHDQEGWWPVKTSELREKSAEQLAELENQAPRPAHPPGRAEGDPALLQHRPVRRSAATSPASRRSSTSASSAWTESRHNAMT
jgi:small subunit ribosomal protein S3